MKIYTRTGDDGTTGLFGGGRVPKHHLRIESYGSVDETNSVLGLARAHADGHPDAGRLSDLLRNAQEDLFIVGADLATPLEARAMVPRTTADQIARLEAEIDALEADLPELRHFILPGGHALGATLHIARTVARRAERCVVALAEAEPVNEFAPVYLNRLSDFLFVLARWSNHRDGSGETPWIPG
ncbi:MAG: cob(I)yrinic acid a,c-diamide adenosyltransferase [Rhodothermales bacterium]